MNSVIWPTVWDLRTFFTIRPHLPKTSPSMSIAMFFVGCQSRITSVMPVKENLSYFTQHVHNMLCSYQRASQMIIQALCSSTSGIPQGLKHVKVNFTLHRPLLISFFMVKTSTLERFLAFAHCFLPATFCGNAFIHAHVPESKSESYKSVWFMSFFLHLWRQGHKICSGRLFQAILICRSERQVTNWTEQGTFSKETVLMCHAMLFQCTSIQCLPCVYWMHDEICFVVSWKDAYHISFLVIFKPPRWM